MTASSNASNPRPTRPVRRPGTYLTCAACGRLLRIEWATRSIICSCGQKVPRPDGK